MTTALTKILIANRGEIAVRVARACRDEGLTSVAVYADGDRDALHVRRADEAHALRGRTAAQSYLDVGRILDVAARSGADAVHPGYGFLSENADFARAVIDAGLTWIGPPPAAIEALGDKVSARHIAARAGAPLVAGTPDPVSGPEEVLAFADEYGLPIAIKAAFGGGGRGLKVARSRRDVTDLYRSAVREAVAAFGRGECFVERYLDRPRHVETQCLADQHGGVVVVSTRDCSLQRRHQKLVEEAPAPFLSEAQRVELDRASRAILREAGYVGAGTCEFLIAADGAISFLEVNTRLQVEHPVTEEISGIDLVREQFRIAAGEELGYDHVETRGHSIEFRVNAEDPSRGFLPAPGRVTRFTVPGGPGVRVDSGVQAGGEVSGDFDSLLAKLVVTGRDRTQALERARRALEEFEVTGVASVLPFHRAVVDQPAFSATAAEDFTVHTRWIETEFPMGSVAAAPTEGDANAPLSSAKPAMTDPVVVEIDGRRVEIALPADLLEAPARSGATPYPGRRRAGARPPGEEAGAAALMAPMPGTVVSVAVTEGQRVEAGDLVLVLEAMKMEQPLTAHRAGRVSGLAVTAGDPLVPGAVVCRVIA